MGREPVLDELSRSRMEVQWLKWEKDRLSAELEAVRKRSQPESPSEGTPQNKGGPRSRVDSEIDWKLPEDTSGYSSLKARDRSSIGMSPVLVSGARRHTDSTPQGRSTPVPVHSPRTNPFADCEDNTAKERGLHSEVLSFATRPTVVKSNEDVGEDDSPGVGPWPLKRESRLVGGEVSSRPQVSGPRRPTITPDRYDGKVLWSDYHRHFEACRKVNQWTEEQATEFLAASLQGNALRILGDGSKKFTYSELVRVLEKRFGPGQQAESYLVELRHRRQGPKETLQELGQAIRDLTVKAYPEIPEEARERLGKTHFVDAVGSQVVREGIYRIRPKTLDEAILAALEAESFEKVEAERRAERKPTKFARAIDSGTEQRLQKLEENANQQAQKMDQMVELLTGLTKKSPDQGDHVRSPVRHSPRPARRRPGALKCFKCGEVGHFSRECTKPRKDRAEQGNASQPTGGPAGRLDASKGPNEDVNQRQSKPQRGEDQKAESH